MEFCSSLWVNKISLCIYMSHFLFLLFIHIFICAYIVWTISHSCLPHLPQIPLASRQNMFCPLLQFFWREDISNNKKDIVFLLVWVKVSNSERFLALLPCTFVLQPKLVHLYRPLHYLPSWSPSHGGLCQLKITLFTLLQWAHQTLSSLGFPTFLYSSCMHSCLNIDHIFFIHLSISGNLGWSHNLTIVNSASINMRV
jgi:hypothetical protein